MVTIIIGVTTLVSMISMIAIIIYIISVITIIICFDLDLAVVWLIDEDY